MKETTSYDIQGFASDIEKEIARLKAQVDLFWEKELRALRSFGLRDGMSIVECGSGPGFLIEKLAEAFPSSRITGFDIDPLLVEKSRELLGPLGDGRIRLSKQSIMRTDFPDESFDFAIARLVVEHLFDPQKAVGEVRRILKTGGKAVFIDNDFDLHLRAYPDIPELGDLYQAYCRRGRANGGDPCIGRRLPGIMQKAGFANIDFEAVVAHSRIAGDEAFRRSEGSGIPAQLVRDGYLPRETMDSLAAKWSDTLRREDHVLMRELFMAAGQKVPNGDKASAGPAVRKEPGRGQVSPLVKDILREDTAERRAPLLVPYLQEQIGSLLKMGAKKPPIGRPLIQLGLDSIASVELVSRIAGDFGLTISVVDILDAQSISSLAANLAAQFLAGPGEAGRPMSTVRSPGEEGWEDGEI